MKKIVKFLCVLLMFVSVSQVSAAYTNKLNKPSTQIRENITVEYTNNEDGFAWHDITIDGKFAYCIQPETGLATSNEYSIVAPLEELTAEQWDYYVGVVMAAEDLYSKTEDIRYRYAAQALLHEYIAPEYGEMLVFDSSSGAKVQIDIVPFKEEISEHLQKIYTRPNIATNQDMYEKHTYVLEDAHNIISQYDIVSYDENVISSIEIVDNAIHLTTNNSGTTTINLKRKGAPDGFQALYWVSNTSQNLITVTGVMNAEIQIQMSVKPVYGSFKLLKQDEDGTILQGAEFELYNETKQEVVGNYITNELGEIYVTNLIYGDYSLKETKAPEGYTLNPDVHYFSIKDHNQVIEYTAVNKEIFGKVAIYKIDAESKEKLAGATFTLTNITTGENLGQYTTASNGVVEIANLPFGKYEITEIVAPDGYRVKMDSYQFEINSDNLDISITIENNKILTETGAFTPIYIALFGLMFLIVLKTGFKRFYL